MGDTFSDLGIEVRVAHGFVSKNFFLARVHAHALFPAQSGPAGHNVAGDRWGGLQSTIATRRHPALPELRWVNARRARLEDALGPAMFIALGAMNMAY